MNTMKIGNGLPSAFVINTSRGALIDEAALIEALENGTIAATICQQPKIQGSKPLSLLFAYLTTGETPEKEYNYTAVDIRIKENI